MTHVTCRLAAKNRDQLRNPTLGNRVWATFTFLLSNAVTRLSVRLSVPCPELKNDASRVVVTIEHDLETGSSRNGQENIVSQPSGLCLAYR